MQKLIVIFLLFGGTLFSQGYCKITKTSPDASPKSKLTMRFVGPNGKPVLSRVAFKVNKDSLVQPDIDQKTGTYVMSLKPGTYSFDFFVRFWHDVNSKPLVLKPKTNTFITVKFEAEEIGSSPVK